VSVLFAKPLFNNGWPVKVSALPDALEANSIHNQTSHNGSATDMGKQSENERF
jgi:hypothetical protein